MCNQKLIGVLAIGIINVYKVTPDKHYPDWVYVVNFFAIWGWKIADMVGIQPRTLALGSQLGAYDLKAIGSTFYMILKAL